jgi:hypothetical protein
MTDQDSTNMVEEDALAAGWSLMDDDADVEVSQSINQSIGRSVMWSKNSAINQSSDGSASLLSNKYCVTCLHHPDSIENLAFHTILFDFGFENLKFFAWGVNFVSLNFLEEGISLYGEWKNRSLCC